MKQFVNTIHKPKFYMVGLILPVVILFFVIQAEGQEYWEPGNGPDGRTVISLAAAPDGTIFAATAYGGLQKSTDNGKNWSVTGYNGPLNCVRVYNNLIFVGSALGGFLVSNNGGDTWTPKNEGLTEISIKDINIGPGGVIYAATAGGVFKTTDLADPWIAVNQDLTSLKVTVILAAENDIVYAGTQDAGLFRSKDGGASWNPVSNGLPSDAVWALAADSNYVYAGLGTNGVYRSEDGLTGWVRKTSGLTSSDVRALAVNLAGQLYAGTWDSGVFTSLTAGDNWTQSDLGYLPLNVQSIMIHPANNAIVVGTGRYYGGGIYFSPDNGATWERRNKGMGSRVWKMTVNPSSGDIFAGLYTNGIFRSKDDGRTWEPVGNGMEQPQSTFIRGLAAGPSGTIFSASSGGGLHRSQNNGDSWEKVYGEPGLYVFVKAVGVRQDGTVFLGENDSDGGLFRSDDGGANWLDITNGLENMAINSIQFDGMGHVYVGTGRHGMYISQNDGASWDKIGSSTSNYDVLDIALNSAGHVYAAAGDSGLYRSTDNKELRKIADFECRALAIDANDNIFTGNSSLYRTTWTDTVFAPFQAGLPDEPEVNDLVLNQDQILYAATYKGVSKTIAPTNIPIKVFLAEPPDQSMDIPLPPVLSWHEVSGATRYHLQVATDISFSTPFIDENMITSTSFTVSAAVNDQIYYWRVQAGNTDQWAPWSDVWKFTTSSASGTLPPPAPSLQSPLNGETNVSIDPTFSWNAAGDASQYHLVLSEDNVFTAAGVIQDSMITGTSKTFTGLQDGKTYYWKVRGKNSAGWGSWSDPVWSFTTEPATSTVTTPTLLYPTNNQTDQPIPVFLAWSSDVTAEFEVQVGKDDQFNTEVFHESFAENYVFIRGLDYGTTYYWHVKSHVNSNESVWSETRSFKTLNQSITFTRTIGFPTHDRRDEFIPEDYQILGLPGDVNLNVSQVLKSGAGETWMAYWDNGKLTSPSGYLVPYDGSDNFKFTTGKAFWVIHNGSITINQNLPVVTLNDSARAEIDIHPYWNLITCPYNRSVSWAAVRAVNNLSIANQLYSYNSSTHQWETSSTLEALRGYYFYNGDQARTKLLVPYFDALGKTAVQSDLSWKVNLELSSAETADNLAEIGIAPGARSGFDDYEYRRPRSFADLPAVYFERPEWDDGYALFANDIRPEFEDMESWAFKVYVPKNGPASFSLIGLEQIPEHYQVLLIDRTHQCYQDLRENGSYWFSPSPQTCDFELLVGTAEAVSEKVQSILPVAFALDQNYPNPFNPSTTIPFSLPEAGEITLKIYNLLGQEIVTIFKGYLTAGRHYMVWDGVNRAGHRMPSGIYIYQMITENGRRFTAKMVMIK